MPIRGGKTLQVGDRLNIPNNDVAHLAQAAHLERPIRPFVLSGCRHAVLREHVERGGVSGRERASRCCLGARQWLAPHCWPADHSKIAPHSSADSFTLSATSRRNSFLTIEGIKAGMGAAGSKICVPMISART